LLRNLERVLDFHEIDEKKDTTAKLEDLVHRQQADLDRQSWTMPTPLEVREAAKKNNQVLRINVKGIQRSQTRATKSARTQTQKGHDGEGRGYGTRKKCKIIDVPCTVEVNIWTGQINNSTVYRERRAARLLGHKISDTEIHFDTELVEGPFLIHESNLEEVVEKNGKYGLSIGGKFHIAIRLHFKNRDDSTEAISWIDNHSNQGGDSDWTLLEARWERLPKCPADGEPLLLRRTDEIKLHNAAREKEVGWKDTKSYLLIDMGWRNENAESPLSWCNKIRNRARLGPLPTPPLSEPASSQGTPQNQTKLEWIFKDRKVETKGFRCGVCRKRNFTALDRLRHHVLTNHTNNHEVYHIENDDSQFIKIKISFEQKIIGKNNPEPSMNPPKPGSKEEHLWITPDEKFDLKSWVKGNRRWTDKGYRIKRGRKGPHAPTVPIVHPTTIESRDLREIQSIQEVPTKRYKVPGLKAPNGRKLQVFSTQSRLLVDAGDLLSESDDDPETDYVDAKREAIFRTMPSSVSEKQKAFMRAWDDHMAREVITANRYLADAVYRWVKTPAAEALLKDPEVQAEFEKKLEELRLDELMDKTVYQWSLARSRNLASGATQTDDNDTASGTEDAASAPANAPNGAPDAAPPAREAGKCVCGAAVTDMKNAVLCCNDACLHPEHHVTCVGISKAERAGWQCDTCRGASAPAPTPAPAPPPASAADVATIPHRPAAATQPPAEAVKVAKRARDAADSDTEAAVPKRVRRGTATPAGSPASARRWERDKERRDGSAGGSPAKKKG